MKINTPGLSMNEGMILSENVKFVCFSIKIYLVRLFSVYSELAFAILF